MDALSNILESELNEAVQVKNPESLHRYVSLLTHSFLLKENNDREHSEFREAMARGDARWKELINHMNFKFDAVDKRFEAVDKRFEAVDKRFEAVDKRFDETIRVMDIRFSAVDKQFSETIREMGTRFSAVDKRFTETIRGMDTRFSAVDKQFTLSHRLTTFGFVLIATLMSLYQFLA